MAYPAGTATFLLKTPFMFIDILTTHAFRRYGKIANYKPAAGRHCGFDAHTSTSRASNQSSLMEARCGLVFLREISSPLEGDQLSVTQIRHIADRIPNVREIGINEVSKVISFQDIDSGWRTNVYYTTGTVGTCVKHPVSGKTQMFRRNVDYEMLEHIFLNPRLHTGKGYYTTPSVGVKRSSSELSAGLEDDEETALANQIAVLKPQLEIMEEQLASIRQKRADEARKKARREKERARRAEKARKAEEERIRAKEQEEFNAMVLRAAKEFQAERHRVNNARGSCFDYSLFKSDDFPTSMKDVKCVAISKGGFVAVFDSGHCSWHGIPSRVADVLDRQHNKMIDYIALGPDQYYIRKTNGKVFYRGCDEFEEEIQNDNGKIKFVTFGDSDTYYLEYENGETSYNYSFADKLPSDVFDNLTSCSVRHFSLGQDTPHWCDVPYCITYDDGTCDYDNLPTDLTEWFDEKKKPGNKMKQVLMDEEGCYFVRFS